MSRQSLAGAGAGGEKKRLSVLGEEGRDVSGGIDGKYALDRELGRGEFGVTYLCVDRDTKEQLACKSISKRKLRTPVDVEDVRREVAIMRHLPRSHSIVALREACEDEGAVHLVMERCEGGELFDRIVARGHYTERAAANVTRTIVEVVQLCHRHGVIHRDLKPENFLFVDQTEEAALKTIDFGLSVFFRPGEFLVNLVGATTILLLIIARVHLHFFFQKRKHLPMFVFIFQKNKHENNTYHTLHCI